MTQCNRDTSHKIWKQNPAKLLEPMKIDRRSQNGIEPDDCLGRYQNLIQVSPRTSLFARSCACRTGQASFGGGWSSVVIPEQGRQAQPKSGNLCDYVILRTFTFYSYMYNVSKYLLVKFCANQPLPKSPEQHPATFLLPPQLPGITGS